MMAMAITLAASIDAGEELCHVECGDDQEQEGPAAQEQKTTAATITEFERAAAARKKRQKKLNWNTLILQATQVTRTRDGNGNSGNTLACKAITRTTALLRQ